MPNRGHKFSNSEQVTYPDFNRANGGMPVWWSHIMTYECPDGVYSAWSVAVNFKDGDCKEFQRRIDSGEKLRNSHRILEIIQYIGIRTDVVIQVEFMENTMEVISSQEKVIRQGKPFEYIEKS